MLDGGLVLILEILTRSSCVSLNPCYVGRWTSTQQHLDAIEEQTPALILVMLDGGLVHLGDKAIPFSTCALILVMLDGGLVLVIIRLY